VTKAKTESSRGCSKSTDAVSASGTNYAREDECLHVDRHVSVEPAERRSNAFDNQPEGPSVKADLDETLQTLLPMRSSE